MHTQASQIHDNQASIKKNLCTRAKISHRVQGIQLLWFIFPSLELQIEVMCET